MNKKNIRRIGLASILLCTTFMGMIVLAINSSAGQERPKARKFEEFGFLNKGDLQARLDNLAIELQNNPGAQTYIKFHSGRRLPPEEVEGVAEFAKDYLVNSRNIDPGRIVTVNAGEGRNSTVELWIVPPGAPPP